MGMGEDQIAYQYLREDYTIWEILCLRFASYPGDIIPAMLPELKLNDLVRLRKPHPCGSYDWKIVRLGADIGLECLGCGHRVLLERRELARRLKKLSHPENDS